MKYALCMGFIGKGGVGVEVLCGGRNEQELSRRRLPDLAGNTDSLRSQQSRPCPKIVSEVSLTFGFERSKYIETFNLDVSALRRGGLNNRSSVRHR